MICVALVGMSSILWLHLDHLIINLKIIHCQNMRIGFPLFHVFLMNSFESSSLNVFWISYLIYTNSHIYTNSQNIFSGLSDQPWKTISLYSCPSSLAGSRHSLYVALCGAMCSRQRVMPNIFSEHVFFCPVFVDLFACWLLILFFGWLFFLCLCLQFCLFFASAPVPVESRDVWTPCLRVGHLGLKTKTSFFRRLLSIFLNITQRKIN